MGCVNHSGNRNRNRNGCVDHAGVRNRIRSHGTGHRDGIKSREQPPQHSREVHNGCIILSCQSGPCSRPLHDLKRFCWVQSWLVRSVTTMVVMEEQNASVQAEGQNYYFYTAGQENPEPHKAINPTSKHVQTLKLIHQKPVELSRNE